MQSTLREVNIMRNIFTQAHKLTKSIITQGDDYRATFALALKVIYANKQESIADRLIAMGGNLWEKGDMKRIYIDLKTFNEVTGYEYSLNESKNKFYLDLKDNCIYRRYNNGRPKIEKAFQ